MPPQRLEKRRGRRSSSPNSIGKEQNLWPCDPFILSVNCCFSLRILASSSLKKPESDIVETPTDSTARVASSLVYRNSFELTLPGKDASTSIVKIYGTAFLIPFTVEFTIAITAPLLRQDSAYIFLWDMEHFDDSKTTFMLVPFCSLYILVSVERNAGLKLP